MGHALNNSLQDVLVRYNQNERIRNIMAAWNRSCRYSNSSCCRKKSGKKGIKKNDLGREKFIKEVWKWKESQVELF